MCKVHNQIGCLTAIKSHLHEHNVNEYKSINELINFQKNYSVTREQIISDHKHLIEQEKDIIYNELFQLEDSINLEKAEVERLLILELDRLENRLYNLRSAHSDIIQTFINNVKKISLKRKIQNYKLTFHLKIEHSLKYLIDEYHIKNNRHQYIVSNFDDAVMESCLFPLQDLDRKKGVIDRINTSIYGALGEQKVVRELEKLSDDFILINDFTYSFQPPIYNRQEHYPIKSVQIDHILLSRSGIFLIETKNWGQHSLNDLNLYSPVEQIKRANFALYKILNGEISSAKLSLNRHHWGDRKIAIRNLIVLINQKPIEEFQHVKVLTLNELLGYVNYFKPTFSTDEVQQMANYLLNF